MRVSVTTLAYRRVLGCGLAAALLLANELQKLNARVAALEAQCAQP